MNYNEKYQKWVSKEDLDPALKAELLSMDETAKEDAFYTDVEFGTAGMRGILGAGTNRLNIYVIQKANVGFAKYIASLPEGKERGVAIGYDNRHMSYKFAIESAKVLATYGIKSYIFESLRPTPELSFAVRYLKCAGGIMITASHNPKEHNGYKVYDDTGCQLLPEAADQVVQYVNEVDDELNIRELVKKYAVFENFESDTATNGIEAIEMCKHNEYDLVIMDIMMPELDGFSAVKEIRKTSDVPVIMLSARSEEYDKLYGFDLGIDDYVTKPFSPKELMMRVNAVMNRVGTKNKKIDGSDTWNYKNLRIDFSAHIVYIDGERTELTPKEYELLVYLTKNANIAITREQLLEKVWGYDYYGDDRTLDTHMKSLRKKLGQYADNIITIRRVGYRFETENY